MDYLQHAIAINHAKLTSIVANLVALVEAFAGEKSGRLSQSFYRAVLRVLYPAESAVRRLIIMAAKGVTVTLGRPRSGRKGKSGAGAGKKGGRMSFQLFDTRKRFDDTRSWEAGPKPVPRVYFIDAPPPIAPMFLPMEPEAPALAPVKTVDTARLNTRLAAVKLALETLSHQAQRMARWRARRALMKSPKFVSPLRPGRPPGHRKRSRDPVDDILKDCHAFAWETLYKNTS